MAQGNQILIVDDNPANLKVVGTLLKEKGYQIAMATGSDQAFEILVKNNIDLVLLDVMMPDIDGFEVCRQLKQIEQYKHIPVIFLTASSDTDVLVNCFKVGGVDFITKPFIREELLARLENHLQLANSKKEILNLLQSRDRLYSIIAHDIRSPLHNILFTLKMIAEGKLDPEGDKFAKLLTTLLKTSSGITTLVDNLVEWSRLNNSAFEMSRTRNFLFPVIKESIDVYGFEIQEKRISLQLNVPEGIEATFDKISMYTVFRNLISNAVKFSNTEGKISITSFIEENNVVIAIQDEGKGMSGEAINKIFNRNEPYTSPGTYNEKGSGLGLLLVKDFVDKNQGKLKIESKEGIGTTFHLSLPR